MPLRLFDAHNHLQDLRLAPHREEILATLPQSGVVKMVVNGSCEADWPEVLSLSRRVPEVLPSFGYHPWRIDQRSARWRENLLHHLDAVPCAIGEIGLDRWIEPHSLTDQREVFVWQLREAARRNLPVSIHCLKAWGALLEILQSEPLPACGWVLHSFGGPAEMIPDLHRLGGYFSLAGHLAEDRKIRQREAFKLVPRDRLLIETDAPDQLLPETDLVYPLTDTSGKSLNHPANLSAVYHGLATFLAEPVNTLAASVEENFHRLFTAKGSH